MSKALVCGSTFRRWWYKQESWKHVTLRLCLSVSIAWLATWWISKFVYISWWSLPWRPHGPLLRPEETVLHYYLRRPHGSVMGDDMWCHYFSKHSEMELTIMVEQSYHLCSNHIKSYKVPSLFLDNWTNTVCQKVKSWIVCPHLGMVINPYRDLYTHVLSTCIVGWMIIHHIPWNFMRRGWYWLWVISPFIDMSFPNKSHQDELAAHIYFARQPRLPEFSMIHDVLLVWGRAKNCLSAIFRLLNYCNWASRWIQWISMVDIWCYGR